MSMFDKLRSQLKELDGAKVIVGVQSEPGTNFAGQTVSSNEELLKIAWVHEFGCDIDVTPKMRAWLHHNGIHLKKETTKIHIPERSYIRRAVADGKVDAQNAYSELINQMILGKMDVDKVLDGLGKYVMQEMYSQLGNGAKPVSSLTLERRKISPEPTPLNDTGNLRDHITYRVEK